MSQPAPLISASEVQLLKQNNELLRRQNNELRRQNKDLRSMTSELRSLRRRVAKLDNDMYWDCYCSVKGKCYPLLSCGSRAQILMDLVDRANCICGNRCAIVCDCEKEEDNAQPEDN